MDPLAWLLLTGYAASALTCGSVGSLLLKHYRENRLSVTAWIGAGATSFAVYFLLFGLGTTSRSLVASNVTLRAATIVSLFCYFCLAAYASILETGKLSPISLTWVTFMIGVVSSTFIVPGHYEVVWEDPPGVHVIHYSVAFRALYMSVFAGSLSAFVLTYVHMRARQVPKIRRRGFSMVIAGTLVIVVAYAVAFVASFLLGVEPVSHLYALPAAVGFLLIRGGLRGRGFDVVLFRQVVYKLILFTKGGEVLYSHQFVSRDERHDSMVAAALTAVSGIVDASLELNEPLGAVELETIRVLMSQAPAGVTAALFLDHPSKVFEQTLKGFTRDLHSRADLVELLAREPLNGAACSSLDELVDFHFSMFPKLVARKAGKVRD
ncbi:MAG: hypothetical protein Kow0069_13050 [Promethearchaeota archaeon]